MNPLEPTADLYVSRPLIKYWAATRPPFLLAACMAALIGLSTAHFSGLMLSWWSAVLTLIGAVTVHAGINVFNDYYDALNGTDGMNTERIYPFTGGSRFIQNEVMTLAEARGLGLVLFAISSLIGVVLMLHAGFGLLWLGLAGLVVGWAYSAPPLALNSRGLGEFSVALGFGLMMPLGADFVQRQGFDALPLLAGLPYALLAANLLYINQFPDRKADAAAGKRHWVVRLAPEQARWGYLVLGLAAYAILIVEIATGVLPLWALLGLMPLPLTLMAGVELLRFATQTDRLVGAIQKTIAAMLAHGALLSLGLFLA